MMERDGYMRLPQAAKELDCGERWLRDGANHHGFPHTRMGKAMWFSPEDLVKIRDRHQQPARFRSKPRNGGRSAKKTAPAVDTDALAKAS